MYYIACAAALSCWLSAAAALCGRSFDGRAAGSGGAPLSRAASLSMAAIPPAGVAGRACVACECCGTADCGLRAAERVEPPLRADRADAAAAHCAAGCGCCEATAERTTDPAYCEGGGCREPAVCGRCAAVGRVGLFGWWCGGGGVLGRRRLWSARLAAESMEPAVEGRPRGWRGCCCCCQCANPLRSVGPSAVQSASAGSCAPTCGEGQGQLNHPLNQIL